MYKKLLTITWLFTLAAALFFSCKKNELKVSKRSNVEGKALFKFVLANMSAAQPTVSLFTNGNKLSAGLPLTNVQPYPGGGFNTAGSSAGDYLALDPGANKFEYYILFSGTNTVISKYFETNHSIEANKRYTLYTADTADNIASVLTEDNASFDIDSGYTRVRIINLIPNSIALDFYKRDSLLKANVKYKEYSDYFDIPATLVDSFAIRIAGTPAGPARTATAYYRLATNTNKRVYTIVARGYLGVTVAPRIPNVSLIINK